MSSYILYSHLHICICCSTIICQEKGSSNFNRKEPDHLHCLLKPLALQSTGTMCSWGADSEIEENSHWKNHPPKRAANKEKIMRGSLGVYKGVYFT